jgi:uncharacterized protein
MVVNQCTQENEANGKSQSQNPSPNWLGAVKTDSFLQAVTLPLPGSVHLDPQSRLGVRYYGNINYIRHLHEAYGEEMLDAFATRHYSPGKLLERAWDGEYAGKWLDAATRTAVNTSDEILLTIVDDFASSLIKYQQPDGYMGVKLPTDRVLNDWEQSWDLWNQWNALIGFLTHYEFRREGASLEAASRLGSWILKTYGPIEDKNARFFKGRLMNVVVIGQLVRLYRHTGNEDLLEFVRQVIQYYPPIQQMLSSGEPYLAHPYMLSAILGGISEFAQVTKDYEILTKIEQVWDGLVAEQLFPTGSLGEREDMKDEQLSDVPDGQLQETCATTEWIFFTQSLYSITGKAKYMNGLEQTSYNALLAAQSTDGMKWCYWTPLRYSKHWFHGPTRCCFWSGPRGIARLPQLIYATKENSIYINFFESSEATLTTSGGVVQVNQQSDFPEYGKSKVTLKTPSGWSGKLYIRVPVWAVDFRTILNGNPFPNISNQEGYYVISLGNSNAFQIEIKFDIPLVLQKLETNNYLMCRGPEVLSIDVRDNIDTWLGAQDDLISIPEEIAFQSLDSYRRYQWVGPINECWSRRRYLVYLDDKRTSEPRGLILTPYADAGNEGAAFRTVFPLINKKN